MIEDKYNIDENDLEDFQDFEEYYGLENEECEEDEPKELVFDNLECLEDDSPVENFIEETE